MNNIYEDISKRTNNNIYMGVVGPVRTGKSTFIKKIMELLVVPNITDPNDKRRAIDEMPQSAAGRTIMTTQPKFVPNEAISITNDEGMKMNIRLIDCVGYLIENALGHMEEDQARMVMTPWYDDKVSFETAAETGTRKVIKEHSTIAFLVTTDGTITDIPRDYYENAEAKVVKELKDTGKPFVIVLNSRMPESKYANELAAKLSAKYETEVIPVDCENMTRENVDRIFKKVLYEFPVQELRVFYSDWIKALDDNNEFKSSMVNNLLKQLMSVKKVNQVRETVESLSEIDNVDNAKVLCMDLGRGVVDVDVNALENLYYELLSSETGEEIYSRYAVMKYIKELAAVKTRYQKISSALDSVITNGYGIVMPEGKEMVLDKPEIVRKGQKFGIKLKASAPSIHMIRADIETEIEPIVGNERNFADLGGYLLKEYEETPEKIWEMEMFGKNMNDLVVESLQNKLFKMPEDCREKLKQTVEKLVNDGNGSMICIIV